MGKATANFPEFGPRSAAGKEADGPQGGGEGRCAAVRFGSYAIPRQREDAAGLLGPRLGPVSRRHH